MLDLMHIRFAAVALVFATVPLTGHAARAFTIDSQSATNSDGSARFADPDEEVQNFGRGMFGQSGPLVQFGAPGVPDRAQGGSNWLPQPLGPRWFGSGNND